MSATGLGAGYVATDADLTKTTERNFVIRSWIRAARMTSEGMRMSRERWFSSQHDIISDILDRGATVLVARDEEEPAFLHGFLVAERIGGDVVVHWVFVKSDSRKYGVAQALFDEAMVRLSDGATRLVHSHDPRVLIEGYDAQGRRKLMPALWLERKLRAMGSVRVPVETLVRQREVA
jgi:GNAT superfamily N-acetyltransferase